MKEGLPVKYWLSLVFLLLTIGLFLTSALVGSHIDPNGMLVEPAFFCIPLGYLSLFLFVLTFVGALRTAKKQPHSPKK